MLREVLPAVRGTDKPNRLLAPRRRVSQGQGDAVMFGEKHRRALVIAHPSGVAVAAVGQVGRQQHVQVVIGELPLQGLETNLLKHYITVGVGEHLLVDAVASAHAGISQLKPWNAGVKGAVFKSTMTLFFRKKLAAIGDDEPKIASTSLVDTRVVNFVQDAVAESEPNFAVLVEGRADPAFGARGPAGSNPRPAGSVTCGRISHGASSSGEAAANGSICWKVPSLPDVVRKPTNLAAPGAIFAS